MLLVSLPLLFEVIFVGTLVHLLLHLEDALNKQTQSKAIVCNVNQLVKVMYASVEGAVTPGAVKQKEYAASLPLVAESLKDAHLKMRRLGRQDAQLKTRIRDFESTASQMATTLLENLMVSSIKPGEKGSMGILYSLEPLVRKLFAQAEEIIKPEEENQAVLAKEIEVTKARTTQVVQVGVAINIVIALALGYLFSTSIVSRIKLLRENTRRLGAHERTLVPIRGRDEIALLGESFLLMSQKLHQLEARKQEYLSMISHDVRTPLTAIQTNLELLSKPPCGEVNTEGLEKISTLSAQLDSLNAIIDQILTLDKLESGMLVLDKHRVPSKDLVDAALEMVFSTADVKGITIAVEQDSTTLLVDEEFFVSTLTQLLTLSIEDAYDNSEISITCATSDELWSMQIEFAAQPLSNTVIRRLFDRYRNDSPTHKRKLLGSKLALALCKELVRIHQGDLEAIGLPGDKIVFVLTMPGTPPC